MALKRVSTAYACLRVHGYVGATRASENSPCGQPPRVGPTPPHHLQQKFPPNISCPVVVPSVSHPSRGRLPSPQPLLGPSSFPLPTLPARAEARNLKSKSREGAGMGRGAGSGPGRGGGATCAAPRPHPGRCGAGTERSGGCRSAACLRRPPGGSEIRPGISASYLNVLFPYLSFITLFNTSLPAQ